MNGMHSGWVFSINVQYNDTQSILCYGRFTEASCMSECYRRPKAAPGMVYAQVRGMQRQDRSLRSSVISTDFSRSH